MFSGTSVFSTRSPAETSHVRHGRQRIAGQTLGKIHTHFPVHTENIYQEKLKTCGSGWTYWVSGIKIPQDLKPPKKPAFLGRKVRFSSVDRSVFSICAEFNQTKLLWIRHYCSFQKLLWPSTQTRPTWGWHTTKPNVHWIVCAVKNDPRILQNENLIEAIPFSGAIGVFAERTSAEGSQLPRTRTRACACTGRRRKHLRGQSCVLWSLFSLPLSCRIPEKVRLSFWSYKALEGNRMRNFTNCLSSGGITEPKETKTYPHQRRKTKRTTWWIC